MRQDVDQQRVRLHLVLADQGAHRVNAQATRARDAEDGVDLHVVIVLVLVPLRLHEVHLLQHGAFHPAVEAGNPVLVRLQDVFDLDAVALGDPPLRGIHLERTQAVGLPRGLGQQGEKQAEQDEESFHILGSIFP